MTRRRLGARLAATVTAMTLGMLGFTIAASASPGGNSAAAPQGGPGRNGYVGLTYDDGPSATTDQLLAALKENGLRATFFDQGNNSLAHPDLVRAELRA